MARYTGPKTKLSRREGVFLGGSLKAFERRGATPPGQHGARRGRKPSNYSIQLREKQKVKRYYGVLERQFRKYYEWATKSSESTGLILLQILETRLDHVVYLLGFTPTKDMARQLVNHGHVLVNGKRVDIPSFRVSPGDIITLNAKASAIPTVIESLKNSQESAIPAWLERKAGAGHVKSQPEREQIAFPIEEQLIIEYYSR